MATAGATSTAAISAGKPAFGSLGFRTMILAFMAFAVYANSLPNDFVLDDGVYITNNAQVTNPSVQSLLAPHKASNTFRPLTYTSYALQWLTSSARPMWFHLFNVLLHAGVSILLFLLLRKLLAKSRHMELLSFAAAALF